MQTMGQNFTGYWHQMYYMYFVCPYLYVVPVAQLPVCKEEEKWFTQISFIKGDFLD